MEEKEKMLKALLYDANYDEALKNARINCKVLCQEYNKLPYDKFNERADFIKKIISKYGNDFLIEQPFMCDYGFNVEIGEKFYSNHNLTILDCNKVKFGNNVFIGPNCSFYCAEHPLDIGRRNKGLECAKPITVGDNVWFGGSVTVLGGVTIGNGVVVGAGSVVTKDVPDNVVVAGNPAKIIKEIAQNE